MFLFIRKIKHEANYINYKLRRRLKIVTVFLNDLQSVCSWPIKARVTRSQVHGAILSVTILFNLVDSYLMAWKLSDRQVASCNPSLRGVHLNPSYRYLHCYGITAR